MRYDLADYEVIIGQMSKASTGGDFVGVVANKDGDAVEKERVVGAGMAGTPVRGLVVRRRGGDGGLVAARWPRGWWPGKWYIW